MHLCLRCNVGLCGDRKYLQSSASPRLRHIYPFEPSIATICCRYTLWWHSRPGFASDNAESPYQSTIRPRCVRTNRDESVQTNGRLSCKIMLRRMHTTTHGGRSRRLHFKPKTVYQSVLEPPFQAQISGVLSPYTKDCFNTC